MSHTAKRNPKVSIVLPVYNGLPYLANAVQSVLAQSMPDFELIVVDDGSTDGTPGYLQTLTDPRVRIVSQENRRLPAALNAGFEVARGELLTWVSSDNYCAPMYLEALVRALEAHPDAGFAYSAFAWIDENDRIANIIRDQNLNYHSLLAWNPGIAAFMYRRACQEAVGPYDTHLEGAEDWDMWLRITERFTTIYVPEILYYYRLHGGSMTVQKREQVQRACRDTFTKALERNGYELDMNRLYPALAACSEPDTARYHAYLDFGTTLLQSPFSFQLGMACRTLETALAAVPNSLELTANLAVAYGRSAQWSRMAPLLAQLQSLDRRDIRELCARLRQASEQQQPQLLSGAPLFVLDRSSSELFRLEEKSRCVYALTIDGAAESAVERPVLAKEPVEAPLSTPPMCPPQRSEKRPLRITYLISSILGVTGGNQTLLRQANALVARGHKVSIVTRSGRPDWFRIDAEVIEAPRDRPMAGYVPASDVVVSTYFANTQELQGVDAPAKVYYAQGDQYVFEDDEPLADPRAESYRLKMRELSRASYTLPGVRFVANSHNLAGAVLHAYGRKADAILPVCTDQTIFRPLQRPLPGSRWRILVVGPDVRGNDIEPLGFKGMADIRKGLEILQQRFSHFTLIRIANSEPEIFRDFPCEYYFAPSDEMKTYLYGTAHILVYASHYDSCPRPPQEGMAAGAAVICTATPGAMEYCRDGENCLLVPIQSPEAIAVALERLVTEHTLRERLIRGGHATAREYPREREWDEWEALLYRFYEEGMQGAAQLISGLAFDLERILAPGHAALEAGDLDRAACEFTQVAESCPELAAGHMALGSVLAALGRFEEAIPSLRKATELVPAAADAHNQLGVALYQAGDLAAAEAAFHHACKADPMGVQPLLNLLDLYRAGGRYVEATATIKEALRIAPDNPEVLSALSCISLELGQVDVAEVALSRLKAVHPEHPHQSTLERAILEAQA